MRIRVDVYNRDYSRDHASGKGRMVGDISRMDWLEFAKKPLSHTTRMTYFGAASNKSIQTVAMERGYRNRVCRTCCNPLSVYAGICDGCGEPARFLYDNTIKVFRSDRDYVKRALDELRNAEPGNMPKLSEIAPKVSLMVSRDETAFDRPVPRKADLPCDERHPARVRIRRTGDEGPPPRSWNFLPCPRAYGTHEPGTGNHLPFPRIRATAAAMAAAAMIWGVALLLEVPCDLLHET